MITKYTNTPENLAVALAVPNGHVWVDGARIVVFTGADKPVIDAAALKEVQDADAARAHQKLRALMAMTPAEVQAWVVANVTNLAQAQDAIATLAVAVGILARRI